jgi:hypothetical protein
MNLVDELHAVAAALTAAGIDYAICGGIAVTAHGATRSTKDIDILIRPSDVTAALDAVRPLGYSFAAVPMTFDDTLADRMVVELPEGSVTIVSRETLIRMKRLAGRDQDRADIAKLEAPDEA